MSLIIESMRESMVSLYQKGLIPEAAMDEFNAACPLPPAETRGRRSTRVGEGRPNSDAPDVVL